ncbi:Mitochondrial GTPase 1 [Recurvomyces mirabilis]|uniref:Mitochondrial GTPase 1 n=1 Tax=Recurvomyces mirabilis TaxID=574656 RepID=A0AAE0WR47_9PEZI|nr:Mitochondrial GTPase 1 [Recurvomyces mirabilis]KAK5153820.1 Mitochondrial GTPase 1 [Recurvomyces mirabilis]
MAATTFIPRTQFPTLTSLPRSYYLGHHAAGLSKMRGMLGQIDLVLECRDYRIPLTSRNPLFEEALRGKERMMVYTKRDLGGQGGDNEIYSLLRSFHAPTPVLFSDHKSAPSTRQVLQQIKTAAAKRNSLTGSHLMVVGMPNVGKSSLLNALRATSLHKGKVAHTGAQPGVTRKIGTGVKIIDPEASGDNSGATPVYLLDTPGVFIPYVPDAEAMLKMALCGSVKDNVIAPFTIADYLLYHINLQSSDTYKAYHEPTNDVTSLLTAMAAKTGRLGKGGEPDLDGTAMWFIQRWRNGHLGRFMLDEVNKETIAEATQIGLGEDQMSMSQMRKAGKEALRQRTRSKRSAQAAGG